uniref:Ig-like domain-containing protein n=1 Tax=Electrophorus electricus TaxID=8005 RepID=A0AAY5EGZ7_ELEEL
MRVTKCFLVMFFLHTVSAVINEVSQFPTHLIIKEGDSPDLQCSQTSNSFKNILWYKQTQDQHFSESKFLANKTVPESGSLTVKDLDITDSAVYFCAVSQHSVITLGQRCTKTPCVHACLGEQPIEALWYI